jgi:hypothetical protein
LIVSAVWSKNHVANGPMLMYTSNKKATLSAEGKQYDHSPANSFSFS